MWQQEVERGVKASSTVGDVTLFIKQLAYQQTQHFLKHNMCRIWLVYVYSQYTVLSRHGEHQCVSVCFLWLSLSKWVLLMGYHWPAGIRCFSALWFCYWSLVNRGQTLLEQEWIPLFAYEWVFVWALIPSIYANTNSYMWMLWKREQKNRIQMRSWINENVYFPLFVLLPSSLMLDKGLKNCPLQVWECFWYKAFWCDQQAAEGKKKE